MSTEEKKCCEEVESMLMEVGQEVHLKEHQKPSEDQAVADGMDQEAADTTAALEGLHSSKENMHHQQGQEDGAPSAPSKRGKTKKTPAKASKAGSKAKGGRVSRRKVVKESDDEADEEEPDLDEALVTKSRRSRRGAPLEEVN